MKDCDRCRNVLSDLQQNTFGEIKLLGQEPSEQIAQKLMSRINRQIALLVYGAIGAVIAILLIGMNTDVYIFSALAYVLLGTAVLALIVRGHGRARWYWISGICIYIFSALAGFSIGLYTLSVTFILLPLALGHSFNWITTRHHSLLLSVAGFIVWGIIAFTKSYWIFAPVIVLLERLYG